MTNAVLAVEGSGLTNDVSGALTLTDSNVGHCARPAPA